MFYLIQFWKVIEKSLFKGVTFLVLSFLLMLLMGQKSYVEGKLFKLLPSEKNETFFYALISGKENVSWVSRKIAELPGVQRTKVLSKEKVAQQTKEILGQLQLGISSDLLDLDYVGLKVIFEKGLQPRSQELIQEYLVRLVGESKITNGAIKTTGKHLKNKEQFLSHLKKWGIWIVFGIVAIFWLIIFLLLGGEVKEVGYLIEQYQRKRFVCFKIVFAGTLLVVLLFSMTMLFFGRPELFNLMLVGAVILLFSTIHLKSYSWKK